MHYNAAAIFFCLLAGGLCSAPEGAASSAPFIWWSPAPAERRPDGRVAQVLTLKASSELIRPEAWLKVTPQPRFNRPGEPKTAHWRQGAWASAEPWTLAVQAGEYVRVDAFARAEIEGRPHFAQTRLLLYGKSKESEAETPGEEAPDRPEFQVSSNGEFYWPQTGHEFTLTLEGLEAANGLEVRSGQGELLDVLENSAGAFKYIPAHDSALNRAGPRAVKPLIFLAHGPDGESASLTLMVHRSRVSGLNLKAGLAVIAASFMISCLGARVLGGGAARPKERP